MKLNTVIKIQVIALLTALMLAVIVFAGLILFTGKALHGKPAKAEDFAQFYAATERWQDYMYIVSYDRNDQFMVIHISGFLTLGSDAACYEFAEMIMNLMYVEDRLTIFVTGDFVPSRENPIDYAWAKKLVSPGLY